MAPVVDDSKVPTEPVIGVVTEVPGTEPKNPETEGGEATDLTVPDTKMAPNPDQIVLPIPDIPPMVEKVTRFTEIAPDTIGGATFKSSPAYEYDLGNLVAMTSADPSTFSNGRAFITRIKGRLRYPEKRLNSLPTTGKFPVIDLLHGQHGYWEDSYQGYDYLAKDLAEHGYVVLSIDANTINSWEDGVAVGGGDRSGQSRARLVLGTPDRLRRIDGFGQIDMEGNLGKLDPLKGTPDFTRVGIMGHSRGGQGIANTILFSNIRRGVTETDLKNALTNNPEGFSPAYPDLAAAVVKSTSWRVPARLDETKLEAAIKRYNIFYAADSRTPSPDYDFLLAPTDFGGNTSLNHVPLAVLLPACDGDMRNLQGAVSYDHNRFGPEYDTAPR